MADLAIAHVVGAAGGQPGQPAGQGLPPPAQVDGDGQEGVLEQGRAETAAPQQLQDAPPGGGAQAAGGGGDERAGDGDGGGHTALNYNTPAYMPGDADLAGLQYNSSIGAFAAYAGVPLEVFDAIFSASGITTRDYYTTAAMMSPRELDAILDKAVVEEAPVSFGIRLKLRNAFLIMRGAAGVPESAIPSAPAAPPTPPAPAPIYVGPGQNTATMAPGEVTGGGLIPLSDTIDQSSKLEVKMLDAATLEKRKAALPQA